MTSTNPRQPRAKQPRQSNRPSSDNHSDFVGSRDARRFALLTFTGRIVGETVVPPGKTLPWDALTVPSEGRTDISLAVGRGLDLIAKGPHPFRKADVILITDGGSNTNDGPALRNRAKALQATILGIAIGMPAETLEAWCDDFRGATTLSTLDPELASNLFAN